MKKFIITLDTEGDNLWAWKEGMPIYTENAKYLQRFQDLCEQYGFKSVWLTNYEMIESQEYVDFITRVEEKGTGELGMHLHAWNSPPEYDIPVENTGAPYLIEYPYEVMEKKIDFLTKLINERTGINPTSHRAGRWATNQDYFDLLMKYGYNVDCSVTPHLNWATTPGRKKDSYGTDYTNFPDHSYYIESSDKNSKLLEVPVTTMHKSALIMPDNFKAKNIAKSMLHIFKPWDLWIRPNGRNLNQIKFLIHHTNADYIMFMIHSSELMPGGSPTFKDEYSIEVLYKHLDIIFNEIAKNYEGCTLREYAKLQD